MVLLLLYLLIIAAITAMIPISAWQFWRNRRRSRPAISMLWAVVGLGFSGLMVGYPTSEHLRLWMLKMRMGRFQIVNSPDLQGKVVAINTGWDGFDDGSGDCGLLKLGAARTIILVPVGRPLESRIEGKRINLRSGPVDLTRSLGPELVLTRQTGPNGEVREDCSAIQPIEPLNIDYVVLANAPFEYLPEAFARWFYGRGGRGEGTARLFAAPVADPAHFQPSPEDAEIFLTSTRVTGNFSFPLLPYLVTSKNVGWEDAVILRSHPMLCGLEAAFCPGD